MSHGIIIGEQCPYCTKFRSPLDIIHQPGNVKICTQCEQRHIEALASISTGKFTGQCSECGVKYDELKLQGKCGPRGEMAVHFENGKYRVLCLPCDRAYAPKRSELYGQTEFGKAIGLS